MASIPGRGVIKNPPNAVFLVMPSCLRCGELWPRCQCGKAQGLANHKETK